MDVSTTYPPRGVPWSTSYREPIEIPSDTRVFCSATYVQSAGCQDRSDLFRFPSTRRKAHRCQHRRGAAARVAGRRRQRPGRGRQRRHRHGCLVTQAVVRGGWEVRHIDGRSTTGGGDMWGVTEIRPKWASDLAVPMTIGTGGSQYRSHDIAMLLRSVASLMEAVQESLVIVLSQHLGASGGSAL